MWKNDDGRFTIQSGVVALAVTFLPWFPSGCGSLPTAMDRTHPHPPPKPHYVLRLGGWIGSSIEGSG